MVPAARIDELGLGPAQHGRPPVAARPVLRGAGASGPPARMSIAQADDADLAAAAAPPLIACSLLARAWSPCSAWSRSSCSGRSSRSCASRLGRCCCSSRLRAPAAAVSARALRQQRRADPSPLPASPRSFPLFLVYFPAHLKYADVPAGGSDGDVDGAAQAKPLGRRKTALWTTSVWLAGLTAVHLCVSPGCST